MPYIRQIESKAESNKESELPNDLRQLVAYIHSNSDTYVQYILGKESKKEVCP